MAQLKGSGSNDVAAVYAHCLEIAEELHGTTSPIAFDVLWGLNACILVHGRIETASELSQRLLKAAGSAGNETQILLATRLKGLAGFLAVNLNEAIDDFRVVQQLCESTDHTALRFSHASDQGAVARAHQAWAEAIAGEFENSENSHIEALYQAERLKHPHTSAHVMCVLAARAQSLGQGHIAAPLANAGRTIARRHNFEYWEAWADLIRGWHSGLRALETAPAALDLAIQSYKQTGAGQGLPYAHHLRASVALAAGDMATAAATADAGLACCESYGVMFFKAALLLDKSQATSAEPDRRNLIELALVVARRHKAVLFENRGIALRDRSITPDRAPPALVHPAICAQNQFLGHTQGS